MSHHRSLRPALGAAALFSLGCNPLAFENILEDAHVVTFDIQGPSGSVHSRHVLVFPPEAPGEQGHASVAAARGMALAWVSISSGGEAVSQIVSKELADGLAFPIESSGDVLIGGLVAVPDPTGAGRPHALVAQLSPAQPFLSRIVRYRPFDFSRTDGHEVDIEAPQFNDVAVPNFASHMTAVNLDADASDPDYEVAVGSEQGLLVFDDLGMHKPDYTTALGDLLTNDPTACVDESDCYFFTLCDSLTAINGLAAGALLDGTDATFLVGTPTGVTFVASPDTPATNLVGAPVFDCAADFRAAPAGASDRYGSQFLVADLDADGSLDLLVGDPGANQVHAYRGSPAGLGDTAATVLGPDTEPGVLEYGTGLGLAELGGNLGTVLIVGAPGTSVGGKDEVGAAFVYDPDVFSTAPTPIAILEDQNPTSGARHGLWVGGISLGDRDELVVMGRNEGRIHLKINPLDPRPGDAGS